MGNLKKAIVYLVGPIDNAKDYGVKWRTDLLPVMKKFGIGVLNPCNKPTEFYHEDIDFIEHKRSLKRSGMFDELTSIMRPIVNYDYHMVDKSTFIVCYIDNEVHMCGSYHETALSEILKRPLLVVCKQGKTGIPDWMYGMFDHNEFFNNFEELESYLEYIDSHKSPEELRRWKFLDYNKIFGKDKSDDE